MLIFGALRSLVLKGKQVRVDSLVFWLHYRVTVVVLAAAALLVTSSEYFGQPISCGPAPTGVPGTMLDMYCWTRATFSLQMTHGRREGIHSAYLGVERSTSHDPVIYHSYYQWVWIVLFLQAIMFYIPRFVWKSCEGGRVHALVGELLEPYTDPATKQEKIDRVVLHVSNQWNRMNCWAFKYFFCEALACANVIGQLFLINRFLGGAFLEYGAKALQYGYMEQEDRDDPMVKVFPRMTKCTFHTFGPSGNVQLHDALCVLPLNIINEKIYVGLWFWLVTLSVPTVLLLIYRIFLAVFPRLRRWNFYFRFQHHYPAVPVSHVFKTARIGDWFLMDLISLNIDSYNFAQFISELEIKLGKFNHHM